MPGRSVAELGQLFPKLLDLRSVLGFLDSFDFLDSLLVPVSRSLFTLGLKCLNQVSLSPSDLR